MDRRDFLKGMAGAVAAGAARAAGCDNPNSVPAEGMTAGEAVVTLSAPVADDVLKKAVEDQDYTVKSIA